MNDWLLLKCPNCGNLFRVPLVEESGDTNCTMCGQSVHFDAGESSAASDDETPSKVLEGESTPSAVAELDEVPPLDEIDEELETVEQSGDSPSEDEPEISEDPEEAAEAEDVEDADIDEERGKASEEAPAVEMVSTSPASIASSSSDDPSTFRSTDEAPRKTSSIRRSKSGRKKSRRKGGSSRRRGGMDWESESSHRRSGDKTSVVAMAVVGVFILVGLIMLITRGGGGGGELSEEARLENEEHARFMAEEARRIAEEGQDGLSGSRGEQAEWQVEFLKNPKNALEAIRPDVGKFFEAENWEERLKYSADPERVRPLMESYYRTRDDGPIGVKEVFTGASVDVGKTFLTGRLMMDNFEKREFVVVRTQDDEWKVDWESFVGYSSQPLDEFVEQRNTEPQLFRLRIVTVYPQYFNYGFAEEDNWVCYLLSDRETGSVLYGYVKDASVLSSKLNDIFAVKKSAAVTLKIRFLEDAESDNQVEIVEIIGEGWVPAIIRQEQKK